VVVVVMVSTRVGRTWNSMVMLTMASICITLLHSCWGEKKKVDSLNYHNCSFSRLQMNLKCKVVFNINIANF
jgi:hypothetical protein